MIFRFPIFFWLWLCERATPPRSADRIPTASRRGRG
jgi:hypothetical protein